MATNGIPVTVLTGWLGAGKTTLLNRILSEDHGRRWAVVVNEFGEIGIDGDLIAASDEELIQMSNGCVCCTVRGDLIRTLRSLISRPERLDGIIVETTGLADPGPVAQTVLMDHVLSRALELDSVTTVVDALNVEARLADCREAESQIAFADLVVLNKTDLVSAADLARVEARIRRVNPLAPVVRAERGRVSLEQVLQQGGFDLSRFETLVDAHSACADPHHVHDEHCGHAHGQEGSHAHAHDHVAASGISSISLFSDRPMDGDKLGAWLKDLLATRGADILRTKGIIDVAGSNRRLVLQAVHMLLEGDLQRSWRDGEPRQSRLVLIGRGLDRAAIEQGFRSCLAEA